MIEREARLEDVVESSLAKWNVQFSKHARVAGVEPDFLVRLAQNGFLVLEVKAASDAASVATAFQQVRVFVEHLGAAGGLIVVPRGGAPSVESIGSPGIQVVALPDLRSALVAFGVSGVSTEEQ